MMKRHALPLNALRAFEAAARLGKMSEAADELCVTHSAISRQIRGLEERLGIKLFKGPRNQLELTQEAKQLLPKLTLGFDILQEAVGALDPKDYRILDVSCLGTLSMRWLIPRLYDFHDNNPDIEIRLSADDGPVDPMHSMVDVAIRIGRTFDHNLNVTKLFDDLVGPVLSPSLVPPTGLNRPDELFDIPLLHTRTRLSAWADWAKQRDLTMPETGRIFEHFYFMLEAATSGLGIAMAPEILVKDDITSGRLIAPFGFEPNGLYYAVLTTPLPTAPVHRFTTWLSRISQVGI
jgi:DNA-binding transcriptional LysR family regulator